MEGSIDKFLKEPNKGSDLESIVGIDAPKNLGKSNQGPVDIKDVKNLIKDIYSGLNLKEMRKRYSSFNIDFDRNWSWENRVKNAQSILEQYVTLDNYSDSIDHVLEKESIGNNNEQYRSERFIKSNEYLSTLQEIEEMTNNAIKKLDKRRKKVKNYEETVRSSLSNISELINNNFDNVSNYEVDQLNNSSELNLFTPTEPIHVDENVLLPRVDNSEDFEYKISEKEITKEPKFTGYERSQKSIADHIEKRKSLAKIEVKNWFREMSRGSNPVKYLESKLSLIGYHSVHEQEIVQTYIDELNDKITNPTWRSILGEKKSNFFQKVSNYFENKKITSIENLIQNYTVKWNSQADVIKRRFNDISKVQKTRNDSIKKENYTNFLTKIIQGGSGNNDNINVDRVDAFINPFNTEIHKPKLVNATVATIMLGGFIVALNYGVSFANHAQKTNQATIEWVENYGTSGLIDTKFVVPKKSKDTKENLFLPTNGRYDSRKPSLIYPENVEKDEGGLDVYSLPLTIGVLNSDDVYAFKDIVSRLSEFSNDSFANPTYINNFTESSRDIYGNTISGGEEKMSALSNGLIDSFFTVDENLKLTPGFNLLTKQSQHSINHVYQYRGISEGEFFITGSGFDAQVSKYMHGRFVHQDYHNGFPINR